MKRLPSDSIQSLFPTTREILRRRGRGTVEFSKVAIPILNQIVRPFTARWHRESLSGAFHDTIKCKEFREQLEPCKRTYGSTIVYWRRLQVSRTLPTSKRGSKRWRTKSGMCSSATDTKTMMA